LDDKGKMSPSEKQLFVDTEKKDFHDCTLISGKERGDSGEQYNKAKRGEKKKKALGKKKKEQRSKHNRS
jgi:hypothetical protein